VTHVDAIFLIAGALLVGGVVGLLVAFDRNEAKKEREWDRRQVETMRKSVEWFRTEKESQRALELELRGKPWPELRKFCELETGRPCECATRYAVVQNIWWTRQRKGIS